MTYPTASNYRGAAGVASRYSLWRFTHAGWPFYRRVCTRMGTLPPYYAQEWALCRGYMPKNDRFAASCCTIVGVLPPCDAPRWLFCRGLCTSVDVLPLCHAGRA